MSSCVFRYPSHSPTLHQPEPMREDFVWWRKIPGFCTPLQRKIRGICFEMARLSDFMVRQTGLLWHVKDRSTTQISIVHRLS
ncbi:hypothetical protein [Methylobacter svalbardensis]|uniref:hypothetical protein n=1 Tax=Methylobacter svalbardensis TaxID=3080016 RepID=UPI0030ECD34B